MLVYSNNARRSLVWLIDTIVNALYCTTILEGEDAVRHMLSCMIPSLMPKYVAYYSRRVAWISLLRP